MGFGNLTAADVAAQTKAFQTDCLSGIQSTADNAYQQMLQKQAKYEAAKKQLSIFQQAKDNAFAKFTAAKQSAKDENDSNYLSAQSEYNTASNNFSDADIDVDVLRSSLRDAISYSGKMSNSAALANAIIA